MLFGKEVIWSHTFDVLPKAKQSVKFARIGNFGRAYQPADKTRYVEVLRQIAETDKPAGAPFDGPLELEMVFAFPFRKGEKKNVIARGWDFMDSAPDFDNLSKPATDALKGVLITDDGRVARAIITKIRARQAQVILILSRLVIRDV